MADEATAVTRRSAADGEEFDVRFVPDARPLFPRGRPCAEDIVQSSTKIGEHPVGDCYLLAAVRSILSLPEGVDYVRRMFTERADEVTVRFHKAVPEDFGELSNPWTTKSYAPWEMTVKRTIPVVAVHHAFARWKHDTTPVHPVGMAPWVIMLEKAYAAFRKSTLDVKMSYIRGGLPMTAMSEILGMACVPEGVSWGLNNRQRALFACLLCWPKSEDGLPTKLLPMPFATSTPGSYNYMSMEQEGWNEVAARLGPRMDSYRTWLSRSVSKAWNDYRDVRGDGVFKTPGKPGTIMRLEHVDRFLAETSCPADVRDVIMTFMEDKKIFPGKRGTGKYTDDQEKVYAKLADAFANGRVVTAGTTPSVGTARPGEDVGPTYARSVMVKGLVGAHAYTVVGVETKGVVKYVRVQNPWGVYGRDYVEKPGWKPGTTVLSARAREQTTREGPDGPHHEMSLELNDFCKRFRYFAVAGERIPTTAA